MGDLGHVGQGGGWKVLGGFHGLTFRRASGWYGVDLELKQ
jgi:hypothetical protein